MDAPNEARTALRQLSGPWLRRGRAAVFVALADLTLFNIYQVVNYQMFQARYQWPDFLYFYAFAKAGLAHGYRQLYDPAIQAAAVHSIFPHAPFYEVVNPPPFAWLLAPLAVLPYPAALGIWTAAMVAALALSGYLLASGRDRLLFAGLWLGFLPAYIVFVSAPLAPLVMLSLALTRKLKSDRQEIAAGLVLAIGLLKPNLVELVPFAFLAAGNLRLFVAWLSAASVLVVASVVSLGTNAADYVTASLVFTSNRYALRWSLVPIVGDGFAWLAAALLITGGTLWLAWRLRNRGPEAVLAIGVAGSLLVNHHLTPGDLNLLLVPIWLLLRIPGGLIWKTTIGSMWAGAWLALMFPITAIVVLVAIPVAALIRSLADEAAERDRTFGSNVSVEV
ncbi:MAG TPA: glycosyltransferase family 87 protein [Candidatus Dormibacteraeota bacterium]